MADKNKLDLIRQALNASETSIKLARQLLSELESSSSGRNDRSNNNMGEEKPKKELPGITGVYDGVDMVTETGEKHPVPENYASKSILVVGDTLKLVEENGSKRFKQIEHVKRHKTNGVLAKKDGKWKAVTYEGSYKVLPAAVAHFGGDAGDEVVLHLPSTNLSVAYGAIESIKKQIKDEDLAPTEEKKEINEVKSEPSKKKEQKIDKAPFDKKEKVSIKVEKPVEVIEPEKKLEVPVIAEAPSVAEVPSPPAVVAPPSNQTVEDELT